MIIRVWDVTFTVTNLDRAVNFYENVLALFHETDLEFSGGVRQGLRSSPWLNLQSPRWGWTGQADRPL
jgi:catechol 2,3-dioxygenase-like lactoylglutathione lyase family enzyme